MLPVQTTYMDIPAGPVRHQYSLTTMSAREQLRSLKGRFKETTHRVFGGGSSSTPSIRALSTTAQLTLSSTSPVPDSSGSGGKASVQLPSSPHHFQVTAPSIHSTPQPSDGSGDNPAQSISSLPSQVTSSNLSSVPESRAILTPSDPIARLATALPSSGGVGITGTWPRLNGFLQALGQHSDMLGPLKPAMDGFCWCIEMYEVSLFQSAQLGAWLDACYYQDTTTAREDYVALHNKLEGLFTDLSAHFSGNACLTMTAGMNNFCV